MPGSPYDELKPDPLPGGNARDVLDDLRREDDEGQDD